MVLSGKGNPTIRKIGFCQIAGKFLPFSAFPGVLKPDVMENFLICFRQILERVNLSCFIFEKKTLQSFSFVLSTAFSNGEFSVG